MSTLYFIRHAQSEANKLDVLASRQDFPLSEQGMIDAAEIALQFKGLAELDRIVASPLIRAQQTASPFAEAFGGLSVEADERLIEQDLGEFSGMTYDQLQGRSDYMHDRTRRWNWVPEGGGESYKMVAERLKPFFQAMDLLKEEERVLFVTHAVTMRLIRACLEQTCPNYPRNIAHNGEIWKVDFRGSTVAHEIESIFLGSAESANARA